MMTETGAGGGTGALLRLLHLAGRLKQTPRAGWVLRGVEAPESVADHAWRVALLALLLSRKSAEPVDGAHCVQLAVVHDLAEALVGDITPFDGVARDEKQRREAEAMRELATLAGDGGLLELWREYAAGVTPEARLVKECDALETALQAAEYAAREHPGAAALAEFQQAARARVGSPAGRALLAALQGELGTADR